MKVLLVDDQEMVRRNLRQMLELAGGFEVVGEADNGASAVDAVEELQPDVVLMDIKMPEMSGIQATSVIKSRHPEVNVVALTAFGDIGNIAPMLDAGASGYLQKGGSAEELLGALIAADSGGAALGTSVTKQVIENLTRLYRQEQERSRALEDVDELKTKFMSIVSHELRTPITTIRAGAKTLSHRWEQLDKETVDGFLEAIERRSEDLTRLIDRILIVSEIHATGIDVQRDRFPLEEPVKASIEGLSEDERARVSISVDPVAAIGHAMHVREIVASLVDNALKYTTGKVHLSAFNQEYSARIEVRDEGPGLNDHERAQALSGKPFSPGDSSNTREVGGLGLSLFIATHLLRAMGGRLEVHTSKEHGSTFTVVMNVAEERLQTPRAAPSNGFGRWRGTFFL